MIKKRLVILTMILTMILTNISLAGDLGGKHEVKHGVNVVTIDLNNKDLKFEVVTANNKVVGNEGFKSMVNRKKPIAAINGNFFDAYKTLVPFGTIIKNGKVINLEGDSASLYVDDKNKIGIEEFSIKINGFLDGKKKNEYNNATGKMDFYTFNIWYVNTALTDTSGVYLFTRDKSNSMDFKKVGTAIVVKDNKIQNVITNPGKVDIPEGGYIIYYGRDAATKNYINDRFRKDREIDLEYIYSNEVVKDQSFENKIEQMIAAGPMLVKDGKNVTAQSSKKFKENKITTGSAQRSAIGITKDNKLLLVTKSGITVNNLANAMIKLGCTEAMNLDGGASSALYFNNKYITNPGRKLNNTFMILKK